jgi:hypothetical protein
LASTAAAYRFSSSISWLFSSRRIMISLADIELGFQAAESSLYFGIIDESCNVR